MSDFRQDLRTASRLDHDRVDRLFGRLDLKRRNDFSVFLKVHGGCFITLKNNALLGARTRGVLQQMIDDIQSDLGALGEASDPRPSIRSSWDPLAVDYIVGGSRMGSAILKRQWSASPDALVQGASRYFSAPYDPAFWRDTCAALSEIAVDSGRANLILSDVRQIFASFADTFIELTADRCEGHRVQ